MGKKQRERRRVKLEQAQEKQLTPPADGADGMERKRRQSGNRKATQEKRGGAWNVVISIWCHCLVILVLPLLTFFVLKFCVLIKYSDFSLTTVDAISAGGAVLVIHLALVKYILASIGP